MESVEAERVAFIETVDPAEIGAVEKWLLATESVIKRTLHKTAGDALQSYAQSERSKWILEWPGQLVLNCSQVFWTQVRQIKSQLFLLSCLASCGHAKPRT